MKIVLTPGDLWRLLGLPEDTRVVGVAGLPDPSHVHVLVEGDSLPETRSWPEAVCNEELAAAGVAEAPLVWHPIHGGGGEVPKITWGEWEPGGAWVPGDPTQSTKLANTAGCDGRARNKVLLNSAQMGLLFGLPEGVRAVDIYQGQDPGDTWVVLEGDHAATASAASALAGTGF